MSGILVLVYLSASMHVLVRRIILLTDPPPPPPPPPPSIVFKPIQNHLRTYQAQGFNVKFYGIYDLSSFLRSTRSNIFMLWKKRFGYVHLGVNSSRELHFGHTPDI